MRSAAVAALAVAALGVGTTAATAQPATPASGGVPAGVGADSGQSPLTYGGSAYGTSVSVAGGVLNSGPTARTSTGCHQDADRTRSNSVLGVDIPGLADVGAVETTITTSTNSTVSEATIAGIELLNGEIEVGAITTTATASRSGGGGLDSEVDFEIASLSVGGEEVEITGEEQVIRVAGLATITLNKETNRSSDVMASATGTAITVQVLETGAVVQVGYAQASVDTTVVDGFIDGYAFGSTLNVNDNVVSGRTANRPQVCLGTDGLERFAEVAGADLGSLGSITGVRSTVSGEGGTLPSATSTSEIAGVSLLGGTVGIEAIEVTAKAWLDADGELHTDAETDVGSLQVAGLEIPLPDLPGETISLPGIGSLTFMDVDEVDNGIQVTGLRLNLLNGTADLVLGQAVAQVHPN